MVKNPLASAGDAGDPVGFDPWVEKIPLEKEMATHSRILAWRIPRTEETGALWSIGWQRVRYDRSDLAHIYIYGCIYTHTHTYICIIESLCGPTEINTTL